MRWRAQGRTIAPAQMRAPESRPPGLLQEIRRLAGVSSDPLRSLCLHAIGTAARICWTPWRELASVCLRVGACSTSAGAPPVLLRLAEEHSPEARGSSAVAARPDHERRQASPALVQSPG